MKTKIDVLRRNGPIMESVLSVEMKRVYTVGKIFCVEKLSLSREWKNDCTLF